MSPSCKKYHQKIHPGPRCFWETCFTKVLPKRQDPCARALRLRQFHEKPRLFWTWNSGVFVSFFCCGLFRWVDGNSKFWRPFFGGRNPGRSGNVNLLKVLGFFFWMEAIMELYRIKSLPRHWVIWRSFILQGLHFQLLLNLVFMFVDFGIIWHVFILKIYTLMFVRSGNAFFRLGKRIFLGWMRACQEFFGLTVGSYVCGSKTPIVSI